MKNVNNLLKELGISKVKLAKYLGVSRQMVYNYLEMDDINEWPKDKKTKLFILFDVQDIDEVKNIKPSNEYMVRVEKLLSDSEKEENSREGITTDLKGLNKKSQKVLFDIVTLLKERLSEDSSEETSYNTFRYLYNFLQVMDDVEELRYVLAYFAKSNGFIKTNEYSFNEEKQIIFEGIMYQAISLFNNGGFSKSKVIETHRKFEAEIEQRNEEKLSRTQELYTVKSQALKELGYTEINEKNATEVFERIAEIQSRKI
ncbi:MAG: hypothetical protein II119_00305 [Bacilli bacterium]|nr:hypothetical protein [Bacilli bacterium]MBQ6282146.1 hypothetical protein [Bacilli bacterium]